MSHGAIKVNSLCKRARAREPRFTVEFHIEGGMGMHLGKRCEGEAVIGVYCLQLSACPLLPLGRHYNMKWHLCMETAILKQNSTLLTRRAGRLNVICLEMT
jgi:hypothetical protein